MIFKICPCAGAIQKSRSLPKNREKNGDTMVAKIIAVTNDGIKELHSALGDELDDFEAPKKAKQEMQFDWYIGHEHRGLPLLVTATEKCIRRNGLNLITVVCAVDGSPLAIFDEYNEKQFLHSGRQFVFVAPKSIVVAQLFHRKDDGSKPDDFTVYIHKLQIDLQEIEEDEKKQEELFLKRKLLWSGKRTTNLLGELGCYGKALEALHKKHLAEIDRGATKTSFYSISKK